jgi:hypothetical protein
MSYDSSAGDSSAACGVRWIQVHRRPASLHGALISFLEVRLGGPDTSAESPPDAGLTRAIDPGATSVRGRLLWGGWDRYTPRPSGRLAQLVRARASHARGRGFKSLIAHSSPVLFRFLFLTSWQQRLQARINSAPRIEVLEFDGPGSGRPGVGCVVDLPFCRH